MNATCAQVGVAPPTATGGTIEDGTYVLTSIEFFGGCPGSVASATAVFCGSQELLAFASVAAVDNYLELEDNTFTTAGSTITITSQCQTLAYPRTDSGAMTSTQQCGCLPTLADQFTASPTQVVLFVSESAGVTEMDTYVRQ